jgi:release factor glutamine methyltransferase
MALASGTDGTEALLHIIAEAPRFLTIAGLLALETGSDQHAVLRERAAGAGFARIESLRDLRDLDRYLLAWRQ